MTDPCPLPAKVITGGQEGADLGALRAAAALGIPTGGYMPRNFKTEWGSRRWYAQRYGMVETAEPGYTPRTILNVNAADVVVLFGAMHSAGSRVALRLRKTKPFLLNPTPEILAAWIASITRLLGRPLTVNVGGNRESGNPGIEAYVFAVIVRAWDTAKAIATPVEYLPTLEGLDKAPWIPPGGQREYLAALHHTTVPQQGTVTLR